MDEQYLDMLSPYQYFVIIISGYVLIRECPVTTTCGIEKRALESGVVNNLKSFPKSVFIRGYWKSRERYVIKWWSSQEGGCWRELVAINKTGKHHACRALVTFSTVNSVYIEFYRRKQRDVKRRKSLCSIISRIVFILAVSYQKIVSADNRS